MEICSSELKIGEVATITSVNLDAIPLKLLEMASLPGNSITLIQIAPLGDPLYFNVNDSHVAIRIETAREITVSKI